MDNAYAAWAARRRVPLGFAMAVAFLIMSKPTFYLLIIGGGIALLGLFWRGLAAGYLEKGKVLAISGPYRYTRNPLYLGSFMMGLGFAVAGGSWLLGVGFLGFFLTIYWPVMRREETELRQRFSEAYDRYAGSVAQFIPNFYAPSESNRTFSSPEKFDWHRYRMNREYEAALGYLIGLVVLALKLRLR
jgi:protein-S-isoprenylcysteine O-methyltransferase Ste14